jgi:hypothetical protein
VRGDRDRRAATVSNVAFVRFPYGSGAAVGALFSGGRRTLGARVDATRAHAAAARDAAAVLEAGPADAPGSMPAAGPPPPGDDPGPWIWVRHPQERGIALCRAVAWVRTASGAWGLRVDLPIWVGCSVPGGFEIDDARFRATTFSGHTDFRRAGFAAEASYDEAVSKTKPTSTTPRSLPVRSSTGLRSPQTHTSRTPGSTRPNSP